MYSEKATKFCKIFNLLLSYEVPVKSKVKISQNFVAFSEYMNFMRETNLGSSDKHEHLSKSCKKCAKMKKVCVRNFGLR